MIYEGVMVPKFLITQELEFLEHILGPIMLGPHALESSETLTNLFVCRYSKLSWALLNAVYLLILPSAW